MSIGPLASLAVAISSLTLSSRPASNATASPPADLLGDGAGALLIAVGDHHRPGAFGVEASDQRLADAAGRARHHYVPVGELHSAVPYVKHERRSQDGGLARGARVGRAALQRRAGPTAGDPRLRDPPRRPTRTR